VVRRWRFSQTKPNQVSEMWNDVFREKCLLHRVVFFGTQCLGEERWQKLMGKDGTAGNKSPSENNNYYKRCIWIMKRIFSGKKGICITLRLPRFARNDVRKREECESTPLFGFLIRYIKIDFMNYFFAGRRYQVEGCMSLDGKNDRGAARITNSLRWLWQSFRYQHRVHHFHQCIS